MTIWQSLKLEHLFEDFPAREVSLHSIESAGTKHASHGAADLARHTNRSAGAIAQQNAFDSAAVGELQEQLLGSVVGTLMSRGDRPKNFELGLELGAQTFGQIGHRLEGIGPLLKDPRQDLTGAELWPPALRQPGDPLRLVPIEKMLPPGLCVGRIVSKVRVEWGLKCHLDGCDVSLGHGSHESTTTH
jgi:hypothetical protein